MNTTDALVHVRTPTYRRPDALTRCLRSLQAQTWNNWVCDVLDDDPDEAGRAVCQALGDPRIRYTHNQPRRYASLNIDKCFSRDNPHGADYFFVLEDDNSVLPTFIEDNIRILRRESLEILQRNQVIEYKSGTAEAYLGSAGVLDGTLREGTYSAHEFRTALLSGIGISNGGVFWSRNAVTELEIGFSCTATLQEYMRTFSVAEPIYVAMEPLAVWAENGEQTTRDSGGSVSYLKRELDLKHSVQRLQRLVWNSMDASERTAFLRSPHLVSAPDERAKVLSKALILRGAPGEIGAKETARLALRGTAIRLLGRAAPDFEAFIASRLGAHRQEIRTRSGFVQVPTT